MSHMSQVRPTTPRHCNTRLHQKLLTQDYTDQEISHVSWIEKIHQQLTMSNMSQIRPTTPRPCNTRLHTPGKKPRVMDWENTTTGHKEQYAIDQANYTN